MALKKCPFCAGEIQEEAMLCKHCKSNLSVAPQATPVSQPGKPQIQPVATFTAVPAAPVDVDDRRTPALKRCPYCAGEIREEAMLCKHCKSNLSVAPQVVPVIPPAQPQIQPITPPPTEPAIPTNAGDRYPPRMQPVQAKRDNSAEKVVSPATIRVSLPLLALIGVVFVIGVVLIVAGILKDKISTSKVNKMGTAQVSLPVTVSQTPNTATIIVPTSEPVPVSQTPEPAAVVIQTSGEDATLEKESNGAVKIIADKYFKGSTADLYAQKIGPEAFEVRLKYDAGSGRLSSFDAYLLVNDKVVTSWADGVSEYNTAVKSYSFETQKERAKSKKFLEKYFSESFTDTPEKDLTINGERYLAFTADFFSQPIYDIAGNEGPPFTNIGTMSKPNMEVLENEGD